jgi:3-oxoacyl-[acyl-carrier protein] reductase
MRRLHAAFTRREPPADIRGRSAIVTGAARGIGRGIAEALASAGAKVVATDRDVPALERAFGGGDVDVLGLDLETDPAVLADAVLERFGVMELIVNNVGITTNHSFLELGEDDFDRVLHTNLRGPWFLTKALVEALIGARRSGNVVFTSSLHSQSVRLNPHYSASKAAVGMLVRELAYELAPHSIRVNAVSPGWVPAAGSRIDKRDVSKVPLGRPGAPSDIANMAMVLLSDDLSGYVTGVDIPVDGGLGLYNWLTT